MNYYITQLFNNSNYLDLALIKLPKKKLTSITFTSSINNEIKNELTVSNYLGSY